MRARRRHTVVLCLLGAVLAATRAGALVDEPTERRIDELLAQMTLAEKIGQMTQRNSAAGLEESVRAGRIGSILNEVDVETVNRLQRIAVEESRLGIPLIIGRDVIHGFRTVFPIPLGVAATWNPALAEAGARIAAVEAAASGVRWTFAPMLDVSRDARWGRIAESFGEDPLLGDRFSRAFVRGFQTDDLSRPDAIAACAKHFAGYGASESGRDYNLANIPEPLLRNVYLPPFAAAVEAGAASFMAGFHELNGVPASGNAFLLRTVLRDEWGFPGFVVSDWASIEQLVDHGFAADQKDAARKALVAGVDMEMQTGTYPDHLPALLEEGAVSLETIDGAVRAILRVKFALGLFERPYTDPSAFPAPANADHLAAARETALQSAVLLKNDGGVLPLSREIGSLAVIGPLADDGYEQLGTWAFDGKIEDSRTPLAAIGELLGDATEVRYAKGLETSRSRDSGGFAEAVAAAERSDAVVLFLGEEAIITGEAHSRADIGLPGAQEELVAAVAETGRPVVLVILAGRPLTLGGILDRVDAVLFSFHPGTMAGPALADLLFGVASPSGKLPVTFPRMVGQLPMYYNHKNTGRPFDPASYVPIDEIPVRAPQTSLGNETHFLDAGFHPQFPFGFGLSYASFAYSDLGVSSPTLAVGGSLEIAATVTNTGKMAADEIVQLYVRDLVGSITRPVKELKGFARITLEPGEARRVRFTLTADELAFHTTGGRRVLEPGDFRVWIGPSSQEGLQGEFELVESQVAPRR
jgi:beta-glucosidase